MMRLLVTGGAGFIGSNFVHRAIGAGHGVINMDALSYAGNLDNLADLHNTPRHLFVHGSINDRALVARLLTEHQPDALLNFAAESHVDRSIEDPGSFVRTNIDGTYELLEAALAYWRESNTGARAGFRLLHVSTDEVYGSIAEGRFTEDSRYAPNSPYAASKASADHLVRAFNRTYGLPTLITNCGNNYGPRQFPEKLIPHIILSALAGAKLPIYGDGKQVRDWLHVDDHCDALMRIVQRGVPGETYNVGGNGERTNLEVVHALCAELDALRPQADGRSYRAQIESVADRPGHDRRYALDATKLTETLGWRAAVGFADGLRRTVQWYLANLAWCEKIKTGGYRVTRLGLGRAAG
ncbi:MAG: dTDP-glucose 4,6-dehydratase [Alphaproteobacteria bacterium]